MITRKQNVYIVKQDNKESVKIEIWGVRYFVTLNRANYQVVSKLHSFS